MQEFLATENIEVGKRENAGSKTYTADDLNTLFDGIDKIYASRGKTIKYFDLRQGMPPLADLQGLVLGPTGNFRAPAVRKGRTLIVGFSETNLRKVFPE